MSKPAVGVVILLVLIVAPASFFLYRRSVNSPAETKQAKVQESTQSAKDVLSSPSSEMRQIQNTVEKIKNYQHPPEMALDMSKSYSAIIKTNKGSLTIQLDAKATPVTVNNFVFLAREGFYDQTVFHRIISGFMIQGGDPEGTGRGGPGYTFPDEPITKPYTRGTIAMANRGKDTNGSQFFIMHQDYALPPNYVIFGRIDPKDAASLKTLDAIAATPVGASDTGEASRPLEQVVIESVIIKEL